MDHHPIFSPEKKRPRATGNGNSYEFTVQCGNKHGGAWLPFARLSVDLSYGMCEISMIPMTMMDDPNVLFPHKRVENSTRFQFYREFLEFNKRIGVIQISYCKIHSCAAEQNWCKARPSFCTHLRHHGSLRTCSHRILEKYCLSPSLC